jgi:hypothetical protein
MQKQAETIFPLFSWHTKELVIISKYSIMIFCTKNWSSSTYFPNLLIVLEKEFPSMPFLNQALGKDFQFDPILIATSP